jgi:hypothetical protein
MASPQAAQIVTVARQLRLEFVEFAGEDRLDHAGGDGLGADLEPGLERAHQMSENSASFVSLEVGAECVGGGC